MLPDDPPSSRDLARTRALWALLGISSLLLLLVSRNGAWGDAPEGSGEPGPTGAASPPAAAALSALAEPPPRRVLPPVPLDPATRRALSLGPRERPGAELALGRGRLAVLGADSVVVRHGARFGELVRIPLVEPRAVGALADGSLVGVGASGTVRLMPHDRKARAYARLPLLPLGSVLPDRADPERIWVLGGGTLFGHTFGAQGPAGLLPIEAWRELPDFDGRSVGSIRDGSFVYTTASGLRQFHGAGPKRELEGGPPAGHVLRILAGSRPDTLWLITREGEVSLYRILSGKLSRLVPLRPEAPVFDAAESGQLLALLELHQPRDAPWSFVVEVFDSHGALKVRVTVPAVESLDDDWASRLMQSRSLALSADPGRLVVGGPAELHVFDLEKGERIPTDP